MSDIVHSDQTVALEQSELGLHCLIFLLYFSMNYRDFSMNYRDFSVKSKLIILLFQTMKLSFLNSNHGL